MEGKREVKKFTKKKEEEKKVKKVFKKYNIDPKLKGLTKEYKYVTAETCIIDNIVFSEYSNDDKKNSGRVRMFYKHSDKSYGPFILVLAKNTFSFGVKIQEFEGNPNGHVVPFVIRNGKANDEGPTDEQNKQFNILNDIYKKALAYLISIKKDIKITSLSETTAKDFFKNPIYPKTDDEEIDEEKSQSIYVKTIENKEGKIFSKFYNKKGKELLPLNKLDVPFTSTPAILIDSITNTGSKLRMQNKLWETVNVEYKENINRRLLKCDEEDDKNNEEKDEREEVQVDDGEF